MPLRILVMAAAAWLAQTHTASADTIVAAAKPYIVGGGFAAVFVSLSVFLIVRGRGTRRMGAQSVTWPVAEGRILEVSVRIEKRNDGGGNGIMEVYVPQARYAYNVAGKQYEGTLIRPGIAQFGYGVRAVAQAHVDLYKASATVPVHYDPNDPSIAVLETSEYGGGRNIIAVHCSLWSGSAAQRSRFGPAAWTRVRPLSPKPARVSPG